MSREDALRDWIGARRSIFGVKELVCPSLPVTARDDICYLELTNFEVVPIPEGVERDEEEPPEDAGFGALKNSGGDDIFSTSR